MAKWHHMATEIWVNIGLGNGLLPDGTKPSPEPMLIDHQWSPVTFILGQFHKRCLNHQSLKSVWKLRVWNIIQISQGPMSSCIWFILLQDPKVYVQTILDVHKKYNALVLVAFNNDAGFVAALDKACGRFINVNAVTKMANSSSKSPELLARYCDLLLKKRSVVITCGPFYWHRLT